MNVRCAACVALGLDTLSEQMYLSFNIVHKPSLRRGRKLLGRSQFVQLI